LQSPRIDGSEFPTKLPEGYILTNRKHHFGGPRYAVQQSYSSAASSTRPVLIDRYDEISGRYFKHKDLAMGQTTQHVAVKGEGWYGGALLEEDVIEQLKKDLQMIRFTFQRKLISFRWEYRGS
jgi:hypothetical protein